MKKQILPLVALSSVLALSAGALAYAAHPASSAVHAENTFLIQEIARDGEGNSDPSAWGGVETYAMSGPNGGTVAFASVDTRLFFRMVMPDTTHFSGKDKIDYKIRTNGKVHGQQGNFDPWLTVNENLAYGQPTQMLMSYDAEAQQYTAIIGFEMGGDFATGAKISVEVNFHDVTEATQNWGEGAANTFSADLWVKEKSEEPIRNTYLVQEIARDGEGNSDPSAWDSVETYAMSGPNGGTVAFGSVDTRLYFRMVVPDEVFIYNKEKIDYKFKIGSKVQGQQGNWDNWLTANERQDYGQPTQVAMSYDAAAKQTIALIGFEMGEDFVTGAKISAEINYHDVTSDSQNWGEGAANSFSADLYIKEKGSESSSEETSSEESSSEQGPVEGVVAGPENTDLGIVVTDIAKLPTDKDWATATAYDMIPLYGDTTGATGTIKILTSNDNYFWRMDVNDPTINKNTDGLYIKVSTVGEEPSILYEGRGNFDNWIAEKTNNLGQPSLREDSFSIDNITAWESGVVTHKEGYYGKTQAGDMFVLPGGQIRLEVRYRDSRSSKEQWVDGDYLHTVYFDQVITFGEKADTTIRPNEPTEGFVGSSSSVSYSKATIEWDDLSGADTYKLFVYQKNAEGDPEPYTYLRTEGPFYAGDGHYAEEITGLSEDTEYAIQVVAYDVAEEVIGNSALVSFATPKRGAATSSEEEVPSSSSEEESVTSEEEVTSKEEVTSSDDVVPEPEPEPEKKGCGGSIVAASSLLLAVAGLGAAVLLKKKKD
ncbi:MAG: hypothetical protein ACI4UT_04505 [Candidatus Enteromonas sp.]